MSLKPCTSVLYKSPTPLAWGEAVPRKRENQINTLVLKDINFTINIIELSYYRTIDTLNQSNKCSRGKSLPKPKEGMSITLLTGSQLFQTISNKDIPSSGGAWGGLLRGYYPACGPGCSSLPSPLGEGSWVRLFFLAGLSTDTSAA